MIVTCELFFPQVDVLLESYRKVGESISNKTSSSQSQNFSSSTSSRRKLYRKGDSCTEDHDVVKKPSNEGSCETNTMQHEAPVARSVQSNEAESGIESGAPVSDRNNDKSIKSVQRTTESQRAEILQKTGSVQIQQNDVEDPLICGDDAELVTQPENQSNSHTKKIKNQQTYSSNDQHENIEDDASNASSMDQSTSQKSNKQALEDLEDWSDSSTVGTSKKTDNEDHCSGSNDLEPPTHVINEKQLSKESSVRQARSKNENNENVNVSPSKNKGSRLGRSKAHVQENDYEEEEDVVLIDGMPPSNKAQGRRGHPKKKPINTKNVRENDSEEDDVVVMEKNNEEKTSKPGSQPSKKPEKQHVRSRQPINTKNVRENDSDEDDAILMENVEVVPSPKKSENQQVRSKQPINTKNVHSNHSEDDDDIILVNNVDVPPSKKIRGRQGRLKKQPPNNTKNVREDESKKANGVLTNENTEDDVPPSKKTESSSGRPKRKNANTNEAGANDSDEDDNALINNNEEKAASPLKQSKRRHGRSNKQPTTKKKAREIVSGDDGELSINENDEQEDEPPLKKTRSKQQNNVVDVPPTKKTGNDHNRAKKQPILEESDRENGSDVEDVLMTSSICFDPSLRLADSDSEEAIEKKKPSKTLKANVIDDEVPIDEREEEVAKPPQSKDRSKKQRVHNVEKKVQQSKKPQTRKRHLDNEDEPKNAHSNAKKKRLNVEDIVTETNDPDQLENEIDERPAEENTGKKRKRNQPKLSRLPNRRLNTEEVSSTTEQNDDQLSQNSGSKKPKQKKSKWDVVQTNTRYFPLKDREVGKCVCCQ